MKQTAVEATCSLSLPEDDHHHPAEADGDHPHTEHLQEMQEQHGEKAQDQYQQPKVLVVQSMCLQNIRLVCQMSHVKCNICHLSQFFCQSV